MLLASLSEELLAGQKLRILEEEIVLETLVTQTVKVLLVKGLYRRRDRFHFIIVTDHYHRLETPVI